MRSRQYLLPCVVAVLTFASLLSGQQQKGSESVPQLVSFSGRLSDRQGKAVPGTNGVTFAIYKDQYQTSPLWVETQNVTTDPDGRYTVMLGATKAAGLPLDLFSSGGARWLGAQVSGQEEQPRVLLLSVPYALKAADAVTLGGLPPSAFVLAAPSNNSGGSAPSTTSSASSSNATIFPPVGGGGTQNFLPLWLDNNGNLGNSVLFQTGTGSSAKIGLNITTPLATLDVRGSALVRGILEAATKGTATAQKGFTSYPVDIEASSFSSTTQKAVMQHFEWESEPTGNNTGNPGSTLNLLFGTDNNLPGETGLLLSNKGVFTFAPGQKFPGAGTVSSVGLSAPSSDFTVSGSPVTTSGTLALGWTVAPTSANTPNAIVKRDGSGAFSAGAISGTSTGSSTPALTGKNTDPSGTGVYGSGGYGVYGTGAVGVYGLATAGSGVFGGSGTGPGVEAISQSGYGVFGASNAGTGGYFQGGTNSSNLGFPGVQVVGGYSAGGFGGAGGELSGGDGDAGGTGVFATGGNGYDAGIGGLFFGGDSQGGSSGDAIEAIEGYPVTPYLYAGYFAGDVYVNGNLSKNGGSFKIDHPLDPANKYLYHSFVESPDMKDMYDGNVTTDADGNALVTLPEWFESLNRDFRYQLTVIGQFAQAIVARKIANHQFAIKTDKPNVEVSWQVTGIRQDAWANAHRIPVEEDKPSRERGFYTHPELYGQPEEKGIEWARHPEMMKRMKAKRSQVARVTKTKP